MTNISNGTATSTPNLIDGYASVRATRNIVIPILGSNVPAISLRPAGLRTGKLRALYPTRDGAIELEAILSGDDVLTLDDIDDPTLDMSFVAFDDITVELEDDDRETWWVEFSFQEVTV